MGEPTFGLKSNKIPKVVMSTLSLRHLIMWLRLDSVNKIREFDGILDEENGDVVANEIPISFLSVELDSKTSNIPNGILSMIFVRMLIYAHVLTYRTSTRSLDGTEPYKDWSGARWIIENRGGGPFSSRVVENAELAMSPHTPCMDYTFGNAFMVEAVNLLSSNLVLQKRWTSVGAV